MRVEDSNSLPLSFRRNIILDFVGFELRGVVEAIGLDETTFFLEYVKIMDDRIVEGKLLETILSHKLEAHKIKGGIFNVYLIYADNKGNRIFKWFKQLKIGSISKDCYEYEKLFFPELVS